MKKQGNLEPTEVDILCGPGRSLYEHAGNVRFRRIVAKYSKAYHETSRKVEKMSICKEILHEVLSTGARFLKKAPCQGDGRNAVVQAPRQGSMWSVVDNPKKVARDKISHSLREMMRAGSPYELFSKEVNQHDSNEPPASLVKNVLLTKKIAKMPRRLSTPGRIEGISSCPKVMDDPFQVRSIEEMIAQPDPSEYLGTSFLTKISIMGYQGSTKAIERNHFLSSSCCAKILSGPSLSKDFDAAFVASSTRASFGCSRLEISLSSHDSKHEAHGSLRVCSEVALRCR